jgi:hypothetical protein
MDCARADRSIEVMMEACATPSAGATGTQRCRRTAAVPACVPDYTFDSLSILENRYGGTPMHGIKAQHWFELKHSLKMLVGVLAWL